MTPFVREKAEAFLAAIDQRKPSELDEQDIGLLVTLKRALRVDADRKAREKPAPAPQPEA